MLSPVPRLVGRDTILVSLTLLMVFACPQRVRAPPPPRLVPISLLMKTQGDPLQISGGSLCAALIPWLSVLGTHPLVCPDSHLHPQLTAALGSLPSSLLVPQPEDSPRAGSRGGHSTPLACFLSFRDHCPLLVSVQSFEKHCFMCLVWLLFCLLQVDAYDPCHSILAESSSLCCQLFHLYDHKPL
ncbi:hypothetical protein HJG60_008202 [Phyllostomus discolor]|uniref:Uncharacterized protein n=1 Tax=Phyllostomus discolor TaxID=89673 RepID=A0A833ZAY9_9CHIR|nr:hypothetical protein HJG60_008202 [Phyllostomus discolor]